MILGFGILNAWVDVARGFVHLARRGPMQGIARMLVVAWAALPALADAVGSVRLAFRLRGERFGPRALVPVLERTLEHAGRVAAALELRGFGSRAAHQPGRGIEAPVLVRDAQFHIGDTQVDVAGFAPPSGSITVITGPTGSGKSTTLAAMIDKINRERKGHIITCEDPIEFIHRHQGCIVNQREVGTDTKSFQAALKYALRQDPDTVLIGEMRDLETIQAGLTISETGHLAFATLHTNSAAEAINRIIDVFPSHQQSQVRAQLAFVLEGIVTQTLLPKARGRGRAMAAEILVVTPAIRALIREDKIHQIYSMMQSGKKYGMQTMNDALYNLYMGREVALEECLRASPDPNEFQRMIGQSPEDEAAKKPGSNGAMAGRR
jgi:energy-coupling factor transporter ATP-binding protein EcfA2